MRENGEVSAMVKIFVAKNAGFCFGVERAVTMAEQLLDEGGGGYSLGPLIHNDAVVNALRDKGLTVLDGARDLPTDGRVILRSHGTPADELQALSAKNARITDATCPTVSKIHRIVREVGDGLVVVIGDAEHPEVRAIRGWCERSLVLADDERLREWLESDVENCQTALTVVFQTTLIKEMHNKCKKILKKLCTNANVFDTICNVATLRQEEARDLSKMCDAMIVIGGRHSANSAHLADVCREFCANVLFIEGSADIDYSALHKAETIGITAGASTPAWIIKEVKQKMSDELRNNETVEDQEIMVDVEQEIVPETIEVEEPAPETVEAVEEIEEIAEVAEDAPEAIEVAEEISGTIEATEEAEEIAETAEIAVAEEVEEEVEKSFEELLEDSIKTINNGDTVSGVIAAITQNEVSVDLETKHSGYIPLSEFTDDPDTSIDEVIKVGDVIEAYVVRVNDVEGTVMLSKRRLDALKNWSDIEEAFKSGEAVEGIVTEDNKGGVVVLVNSIRVFVPASQTGVPKDAPMSDLVRQKVRLKLTEVNRSRRRVVGSIRAIQYKERRERADKIWQEIEADKKYDGVVKSLTSYGAFVDIGGIDGMVHVSELSWSRIKQPSDVLTVGDNVQVYVLGFDKENKKISLGYKDPEGNPWLRFTNTYQLNDIASVKIVKLMPFGAFAEVLEGVDGLIHISQIANRRIGKPDEVLTVGEYVNVKITNIDNEKQKISLSIRALSEPDPLPQRRNDDDDYDPDPQEPAYDALVYEVSASGIATGAAPDEDQEEL